MPQIIMNDIMSGESFIRNVIGALRGHRLSTELDPEILPLEEIMCGCDMQGISIDAITAGPAVHKVVIRESGGMPGRGREFDVYLGEVYVSTTFSGSRFKTFATHRLLRTENGLKFDKTVLSKSICRDYASKLTQRLSYDYRVDKRVQPQKLP